MGCGEGVVLNQEVGKANRRRLTLHQGISSGDKGQRVGGCPVGHRGPSGVLPQWSPALVERSERMLTGESSRTTPHTLSLTPTPESGSQAVPQASWDLLLPQSHFPKWRPREGPGRDWAQPAVPELGFKPRLLPPCPGPQSSQEPVQPGPGPTSQQLTSACPCHTWRSGKHPGGSRAQRRWG